MSARRIVPTYQVGDFAAFVGSALRNCLRMRPYLGEVVRHASTLVLGSTLVIITMAFFMGSTCGLQGSAITRSLGGGSLLGILASFCTTREVVPFIFGFILAAKVGCGIVAELGSMRVREEVDAIEVMGIPAVAYLVSTRLVGALVIVPLIYAVALFAGQFGAWLVSVAYFGDVSQGTFEIGFYAMLSPTDLVYSFIKGLVVSLLVISVALYYGYSVRGGPVEVGLATAKSMSVNLILATFANTALTLIFWGVDPNLPIA